MSQTHKPMIALGPQNPGAGSWEWLGEDLAAELQGPFETTTFSEDVPPCDVVVFVKFKPRPEALRDIAKRSAIVYCPVDVYGSAAEIDADPALLLCDRVVVHCPKLAKYTRSSATTVCFDHHLKFVTPLRERYLTEGPLLWVGVRSNLPPLAQWLKDHKPSDEIWILTNPEQPEDLHFPQRLGLPEGLNLRLEAWTPQRHREWLEQAQAVLDIKGKDFRSQHKPAAKALDVLASGVPLAMNAESSPVQYIRSLGFEVVCPEDRERWLSQEYWEQTAAFGKTLGEQLSRSQIAQKWQNLLQNVLAERMQKQKRTLLVSQESPTPPVDSEQEHSEQQLSSGSTTRTRVAMVSLLFNWPSTGGGTIHTYEAVRSLAQADYEMRHFYVQSSQWEVGRVDVPLDYPGEPIPWEPAPSGLSLLQGRLREAVDRFAPDFVILTDSWTMKPRLAEALNGYKFFLRLAAQECLCPLNNVRMLVGENGSVVRCPRQQLVTPAACQQCVTQHGPRQGDLHQQERNLAGYGTANYDRALRWAFAEAEAVLVVNPLIEAMVSPFARQVRVVPSGFDPARFSWPEPESEMNPALKDRVVIVFAGLVQEWMKGFHVLEAACARLWNERQDFEVWVTDQLNGQGPPAPFIRAIGWQSQTELPRILRQSDIVVVPTVAEEALGRTAVEAMAAGRPVVASRIGGLPWTVPDGGAGLLFEPGHPADLAEKLSRLLDDPALRKRLGAAGRERFEAEYTWDVILKRHYLPLLGEPVRSGSKRKEVTS